MINRFLFLYLIIALTFVLFFFLLKNKVKQRVMVLGLIVFCFVIVFVVGIYMLYDRAEQSIYIMAENNENIEIRLDNLKDYYGHNFYSFRTDLSTEEVLEKVKETYGNAYYDGKENKVIFEYNGVEYKIENEGIKKFLWIKLYKYLFGKNE
ncbi:MAG: hypothetical protein HFG31_09780 [Eubacterium sp.]|nr:hypothetical protein [Eubacterium sp.]